MEVTYYIYTHFNVEATYFIIHIFIRILCHFLLIMTSTITGSKSDTNRLKLVKMFDT